jgi:AcrR family transcriptional regulator
MARRSDHSREELSELVIQAARTIAAAEGWQAVTMRAIAGRIGYAPGSIYNAVGDLDAVLLRVNAATLETLAAQLEATLRRFGPEADITARALAIADGYMQFIAGNVRLWASVLERVPTADDPVPEWYAAPRARLIETVSAAIAPLYPNAKARRRAVIALWAALQGVAALAIGGNLAFAAGEIDPRDIARSIVLRYLTGTETTTKD